MKKYFFFVMIALISYCSSFESSASNQTQAPQGKIVFHSSRDGNMEIYMMNADGTNLVRLTNHPANGCYPSISKDGRKIVFVSDRDGNSEIYRMDSDGSNVARITNHPAIDTEPSISSDGTKIAFVSNRDSYGEIYIVDANGSNLQRVTNDPKTIKHNPRWLRNDALSFSPEPGGGLWMVSYEIDLGSIKFKEDPEENPGAVKPPANKSKTTLDEDEDLGGLNVYEPLIEGLNKIDPSSIKYVWRTIPILPQIKDKKCFFPVWSESESKCAYISVRDGNEEIYLFDTKTNQETRLTKHEKIDASPSWSPDENWIAFHSDRSNPSGDIFITDIAGKEVKQLTKSGTMSSFPSWGGIPPAKTTNAAQRLQSLEGAILGQWLFSIPGEGKLNHYISDSAIYNVNERGELIGINNYVIVNKNEAKHQITLRLNSVYPSFTASTQEFLYQFDKKRTQLRMIHVQSKQEAEGKYQSERQIPECLQPFDKTLDKDKFLSIGGYQLKLPVWWDEVKVNVPLLLGPDQAYSYVAEKYGTIIKDEKSWKEAFKIYATTSSRLGICPNLFGFFTAEDVPWKEGKLFAANLLADLYRYLENTGPNHSCLTTSKDPFEMYLCFDAFKAGVNYLEAGYPDAGLYWLKIASGYENSQDRTVKSNALEAKKMLEKEKKRLGRY